MTDGSKKPMSNRVKGQSKWLLLLGNTELAFCFRKDHFAESSYLNAD